MGRTTTAAVAVLLAGGLLGGCSGGEDDAAGPDPAVTSPPAPVLQPGRPGQPNTSLTGTQALPKPSAAPAAADVTFMQDMVVHHAQAITMVDIALPGLTDQQARAMASRIRSEQRPEMAYMARWLKARDRPVPPQASNPRLSDPGHAHMPGMATRQQLLDLQSARGPEKDRQFLTLMIRHHQGAITMAGTRARSGSDPDAERLGDDIGTVQSAQVRHMDRIRRALPAG